MAVDEARLNEFLGRFVSDLGATGTAGNVVIGHRLGSTARSRTGPAMPEELATASSIYAIKSVKHTRQMFRSDAGAGVAYADLNRCIPGTAADCDSSTRRGVTDGIIQHI